MHDAITKLPFRITKASACTSAAAACARCIYVCCCMQIVYILQDMSIVFWAYLHIEVDN